MLLFRFLAVFGAACSLSAIPAMIGDCFDEHHMKKLLFLISAIFCVYPGVVMAFCGVLAHSFGWRSCEYF